MFPQGTLGSDGFTGDSINHLFKLEIITYNKPIYNTNSSRKQKEHFPTHFKRPALPT